MTDNEKLITLMCHRKRYDHIIGVLAKRYQNRDAAMDAVSDVLLSLMDGSLKYQYDASVKPEAFVIANARYRMARPPKTVSLDDPVGEGRSVLADLIPCGCNTDDAMDQLDASFMIKKLSRRIKETSLGKKYQVFKLLKFSFSPREICDFLNIGMEEVLNHIEAIREQAKSIFA